MFDLIQNSIDEHKADVHLIWILSGGLLVGEWLVVSRNETPAP